MCKIFSDWSPHLRPAAVSSVMTPTSAPGSGAAADKSTLKVYLPNGGFNVVKFGDATDIRGIIALLTCRLGGGRRGYSHLYSMRLVNTVTGDIHCLHQDTTMFQVSNTSNQHNRITKIFSLFDSSQPQHTFCQINTPNKYKPVLFLWPIMKYLHVQSISPCSPVSGQTQHKND